MVGPIALDLAFGCPPGPLVAGACESGMSVEELKSSEQQPVRDVSQVCNAVAHGHLTPEITVLVKVWLWFRFIVSAPSISFPLVVKLNSALRVSASSFRESLVSRKRPVQKGT